MELEYIIESIFKANITKKEIDVLIQNTTATKLNKIAKLFDLNYETVRKCKNLQEKIHYMRGDISSRISELNGF